MVIVSMSAEHEFHGDFDDDVHRLTQSAGRCEPPLPYRVDRTLVEAGSQSATDGYLADGAVTVDDDFEEDVARDAAPASLVRVLRLDLSKETWRLDAASRAIRSAADSTSGAWPNSRTHTLAVADASARSGSAIHAGAVAGTFTASLLGYADALVAVRDRGDRCNHSPGWKRDLSDGSRSWDRGGCRASYFNLPSNDRSFVR
jgi:hypothetical protein